MEKFSWPNESLEIKWTGSGSVPRIGDRVQTYLNNMGPGTVTGYFVEHGFLGVTISLERPPEWFTAQSTTGSTGYFFGLDLEPYKRPETV